MKLEVTLDGEMRTVDVVAVDGGWSVSVDDGPHQMVTGHAFGAVSWALSREGETRRVIDVALEGDRAFVVDGVTPLRGEVIDPRDAALHGGGGASEGVLVSQMPGAVVRVPVAEGDAVEAGQVVCVVEAMKMENEFKAPFAGTVARIAVAPGQAIDAGAVLVELTPAE